MAKLLVACGLTAVVSATDSVVELSLASPSNAYPTFSGAIAASEKNREATEDSKMKSVILAFESAQKSALAGLSAALGKSFMHFNPVEPTLRVNAVGAQADESAAAAEFRALESDRSSTEAQIFNQATAEFNSVAKAVINEYRKALGHKSFLQGSGYAKEMNVKVMGNANYATLSKLASDAEARRDVAEDYVRAKILDLSMQLVKSMNAAAQTMTGKSFLSAPAPASPFTAGLDKQLSANFPGESLSSLRAILSDALDAALAVEDVPASYAACVRDFSGCPQDFANMGSGKCMPPDWYSGNCEGPVDFAGLSPHEKMNLATSCGATFACA